MRVELVIIYKTSRSALQVRRIASNRGVDIGREGFIDENNFCESVSENFMLCPLFRLSDRKRKQSETIKK